jgi:hypothetical protein
VGLNSLKSLNLTNVYPNKKKTNNKKNNNKVKSKPLELFELAGKKLLTCQMVVWKTPFFLAASTECSAGWPLGGANFQY